MLASTLLVATLSAFFAGTSAAPAPAPNPNTRYAQLRLYGKPGCSELNLGELGVYGDKVNQCQTFGDTDVIRSLALQYNPYGCKLHIYSDVTCHLDRHDVPLNQCLSGDKQYRSYKLDCKV
ncbi:hypothetical protein B0T10DRAFT_563033 [Thelonectria olida]|uniref:Uncharacterized protein n=1 Tax=Thelonectria olida TaxID=1576542 RepID=A0A9P9AK52_9HYPO|nr:hypothetical protein B0T10DRAFT_563033 [Thelonectria olida]